MDFHRYGIDPRLAQAAEGLNIDFYYYEKLLAKATGEGQNVCAKISLKEGREEVLLLPVLQWLLAGESRKALVLVQDAGRGDRCAQAVSRLGAGAGLGFCRALRGEDGAPRIEGDASASVLIGGFEELLGQAEVDLKAFGYLVVDGADHVAEQASQDLHRLVGLLLPPWERRTLLACDKISVKAKNLAFDLSDNPEEISIDGDVIKAQSVVKETWDIAGEDKLKFLLGLMEREKPASLCVFCNLKDTAKDVSKRLEANGVGSDYILGALAPDRKKAVQAAALAGERPCLVLTDQGAEGLQMASFPLVVNFDIPLEPELFIRRLEMLDRERPGAKVVSLACDRYIYGLGAVESYIDAKLEARPVDASLLAYEDKSEGMSLPGRDGRQGPGRDSPPRGRGGDRAGGRGQQRRDGSRRDSRQRREGGYGREDRRPDIQRSISDLTGGSLDMGPGSLDRARGRDEPGARQQGRGPEGKGRKGQDSQPRGDSSKRRGTGKGPRNGGRNPRRDEPQRGRAAEPRRPSGDPSTKNPYDTPIEERMKRYREKYGQELDPERREAKAPRGRAPVQRDRPESAARRPSGPAPASPEAKPRGFLERLFGAKKKKG